MADFCQVDGATLEDPNQGSDPYIGHTLLDQFEIVEELGSGGMGTVYRAHQTTLGRDVAIKILHPDLVRNPDAVRRFQREARVSSSIDHPNVVRVFLFGQLPDDNLYLVMQYVDGQSLEEVIRSEVRLPVARALHIAAQICDGVGEAHSHGVVHRDVKPENIILVNRARETDFVKVLDFGIARFLGSEQTVATQTGLIFGTARYISPEGAAGEPTDARSDVYSIGVLLYQMLCGETPFDSPSPVSLLMKHIHESAPHIRDRAASVPPPVADVVMRCLAKNPDARPESADALGYLLREAAVLSHLEVQPAHRLSYPSPAPLSRHSHGPARSVSGPFMSRALPGSWDTGVNTGGPSQAGPNESVVMPALPRSRSGTILSVLAAFVIGASAVTAGVWLVNKANEPDQETLEQLEQNARSAFERGDYDRPSPENVAELTALILADSPDHAAALALRRNASRRLRVEGQTALEQGFDTEAQSLFQRSLDLDPQNLEAQQGIAAMEREHLNSDEHHSHALRIVPARAQVGDTVTLVAILESEVPEGVPPRFVLSRGNWRQALIAVPGADRRTWVASYVPWRSSSYHVAFESQNHEPLAGLLPVDPRVASRPRSTPEPRTNTNQAPQPAPAVNQGGGIDWGLPGQEQNEGTTSRPAPPRLLEQSSGAPTTL